MPRAQPTQRDVRSDRHFVRILESERIGAAVGITTQAWLVRRAKMLISIREQACVGAHQVDLNERDELIRRLRSTWYQQIPTTPRAAKAIAADLLRYSQSRNFATDKKRGPPMDDPKRALWFMICRATSRRPPGHEQVENILNGYRKKPQKPAAQRG